MNSNLALPPIPQKPIATTNERPGDLDQFMQSDDFLQMISNESLANSSMFSGLAAPEKHALPQMDMQLPTPPLMEPNTLMGPSYHPMVGWYFPALPASGLATPVRPFPIASEGYKPATSLTPSPMPSEKSTPNPFRAPQKHKGRRKYGPAAYLEEQAKARLGIATGSKDLPPPSANLSTKRKSTSHPLRDRKNPPVVQTCVCNDKETLKIKRPKNAFIIFRKSVSQSIIDSLGGRNDNQAVSRIAAEMWNQRTPAVDKKFKDLAAQEKTRHEIMYPGYKYQPGQTNRNKFGSASCTCGAYEANLRAMRARDGMTSEDEGESDGDDFLSPRRKKTSRAPSAPMTTTQQTQIPDPSTFGFTPPYQIAEAAVYGQNMKRKRDTTDFEDEEPLAKRRSPRNSRKSIAYAELGEADIFRPLSPTAPARDGALDASPTLSSAGFAQDDSPARNTRSSVSKAAGVSPELAQTAFPFDFGQDLIQGDVNWEQLFEESGLLAEVRGDADQKDENIVVADRRPSSRGRSSSTKSGEAEAPLRRSSRKVSK